MFVYSLDGLKIDSEAPQDVEIEENETTARAGVYHELARLFAVPDRATWLRIFANVFLGAIAVVLRLLSIATVFLRQVTETLDEFFRVLAEGEDGAPTPAPGP